MTTWFPEGTTISVVDVTDLMPPGVECDMTLLNKKRLVAMNVQVTATNPNVLVGIAWIRTLEAARARIATDPFYNQANDEPWPNT